MTLAAPLETPLTRLRIVAEHRGAYEGAGPGGVAWCEVTGLAYHQAGDKRELPTVGDWVTVEGWERALGGGGNAVVREIEPRKSLLVRRAAGEATAPQPLAANVDIGIVMTSANADLSPARLDRYLTILGEANVAIRIVVSKADLVDPATLDELVAPLRGLVPVVTLSNVTGDGMAVVRGLVAPGQIAVILGSSGVGKSTLLNRLLGLSGEVALQTRPIRAGDDRGRHTTTRRELFTTPDGAMWIDTPGMRELGQWVEDEDKEDDDAFDDIAAAAAGCRFSDCRHRAEPGCAVIGTVAAERVASFHKLSDERAVVTKDQAAAKRIAETRRAKAKKYVPRSDKS